MKIGSNTSGRSMIEMLGVLAIIGVISVGAIAGYSRAMSRYRINRTIDETTRLVNGIRTMYLSQKTYSGISSGNAQMNRNIAAKLKSAIGFNPMEANAFGGRWIVQDVHPNNNSNNPSVSYPLEQCSTAFLVAFLEVPEEDCMELATVDWRNICDGLIGMGIGNKESSRTATSIKKKDCPKGGLVKDGSNGYYICAQDMPIGPKDAVTACSGSANGRYNFSFKYR